MRGWVFGWLFGCLDACLVAWMLLVGWLDTTFQKEQF